MDYIRQLNAFRDWLLVNDLPTSAIALWYALMTINNMTGWKERFNAPNSVVEKLTGLSKQGLVNARRKLLEVGLIEYEKGKKGKAPVYRIVPLVNSLDQSAYQTEYQSGYQSGYQSHTQCLTIPKHKHKQKDINDDDNSRPGFVDVYEQEFGRLITPGVFHKLNAFYEDGMSDEVIAEAIRRAAENGAYNVKYISTILDTWQKQNVINMAGVKRADAAFESRKNRTLQGAKPQAKSGSSKLQRSLANIQKVLLSGDESEGLF